MTSPQTRGSSSWTGTPGEFRPPRYSSPQRLLPDGRPYPTAGRMVGRWQERCLVHGEGDVLGKAVRLTMFDRYVLNRMLEYDPLTGRLLHDRVLIGVAKGQSKTEGMARFGVSELAGPVAPLSPRVVMSAASYEQTRELFTAATLSITGSQDAPGPLRPYFREGDHLMDSRILLPDGHGYIERIAAVGGTSDGGKPTAHLGDELHEWTTDGQERVWIVQSKSLRKRRVPRRTPADLGLPAGVQLHGAIQAGITTAGVNPDTLLGRLYRHGIMVARGYCDEPDCAHHPDIGACEAIDPGFLFLWWEADPALDLEDAAQRRQAILQANPCVGEFLSFENKEASFRDRTVPRADFLRYDLNRWSTDEERWIRDREWAACQGTAEPVTSEPAFAAICLAHDHRSAAVAVAQRNPDDGARYTLRVATFPDGPTNESLVGVEGLEKHIEALRAIYPAPVIAVKRRHPKAPERRLAVPGPELVYNGAFFEGSAQKLDRAGMSILNMPASVERLAPAAESMRGLVIEGLLTHGGGIELARQVGLILADPSAAGWRVQDAGPAARAAMLALHRAMTAPRVPTSAGRQRGNRALEY